MPYTAPLKYPAEVTTPPFDKWIRFDAMNSRHIFRKTSFTPEANGRDDVLASVVLYLPENALKSMLHVTWDKQDMGPFAGAALAMVNQGGATLGDTTFAGVQTFTGRILRDGLDKVKTWATESSQNRSWFEQITNALTTVGTVAAMQHFSSLSNPIEAGMGMKINPRTEMLFSSQEYRTYSMDFMLVPRSEAEAKTINQIIQFFQHYMLPKYGGQDAVQDTMIGYPFEFNVGIYASSNQNEVRQLDTIAKIGRCILEEVSVNHAAGDKVAFIRGDDGTLYPLATLLSLSLQEVRLLARGDWEIERNFPDNPNFPERTDRALVP